MYGTKLHELLNVFLTLDAAEKSAVTCEHLLCSTWGFYSMGESWPLRLAGCTIHCIVFELCLDVLQWCKCSLQIIRCWLKYPPFLFCKRGIVNFIFLQMVRALCWAILDRPLVRAQYATQIQLCWNPPLLWPCKLLNVENLV